VEFLAVFMVMVAVVLVLVLVMVMIVVLMVVVVFGFEWCLTVRPYQVSVALLSKFSRVQ
jgi:hypothetical protein